MGDKNLPFTAALSLQIYLLDLPCGATQSTIEKSAVSYTPGCKVWGLLSALGAARGARTRAGGEGTGERRRVRVKACLGCIVLHLVDSPELLPRRETRAGKSISMTALVAPVFERFVGCARGLNLSLSYG
jgi:hypothetical protein